MAGQGTHYTYAQLMGLWIRAGGPRAQAAIAAAIAEAESGGWSGAANPNDSNGAGGTQFSGGLWQLSNGTHNPVAGWNDPATNAAGAVAKYRAAGNSFAQDWGSFTSGAYRRFLSGSTTPDLNVPGGGSAPGSSGTNPGSDASCAWSIGWGGIPGTSIWNDVFGNGGNVGSGEVCLLSKTALRSLVGVVMMTGAGALLALPALALLVAGASVRALSAAGPTLGQAGGVVAMIPGGQAAGAALAGAVGRGAVRETPEGTRDREGSRARARRYTRPAQPAPAGDAPPF